MGLRVSILAEAPSDCSPLSGSVSRMLGNPGPILTLLCSAPGTFWKNPQFLLSVWRPEEGRRSLRPCSVLVSLLQKPRHRCRKRKPHLAIGFYLYRVGGPLNHRGTGPSMGVTNSYHVFLFLVFFTICLCSQTWVFKSRLCPLGTCDLEQVTFLH